MAVLDLARGRAALPQTLTPAKRAIGTDRQSRRWRIAVETGETLFVLILIALGALSLRFGLVLAHGFLN
jgi:hypothetical protein